AKSHRKGENLPFFTSLAYAPDGQTLAVGINGDVVLLDMTKGGTVRAITEGRRGSTGLAFSRDGKRLAGIGDNVIIRHPATGKELGTLPIQQDYLWPECLAFCPQANRVAVALVAGEHRSNTIVIWDFAQQREVANIVCHQGNITQMAWSPDG